MPDLTTSEGREELRRRILARNTHSRALAENWSIEAANLLTLLDLADAGEREWRAIDSAPKDGTRVLVASHDFIVTAEFWVYEGTGLWRDDNGESLPQPTHWMPLPPPPARVAADQPLTGDR